MSKYTEKDTASNINLSRNDANSKNNDKIKDIKKIHEEITKKIHDYLGERGYERKEPLPLIPKELDKSVIFTGSSTNRFKSMLMEGTIPKRGAYVIQPCIRTQDFEDAFNDEIVPLGQTFFHIFGTISPSGSYDKACGETIDFLVTGLAIEPQCIVIKPTVEDPSLIKSFGLGGERGLNIEIEQDPAKRYIWEYGIEGLNGVGISINIRHTKDGSLWDVGNVVSIRDAEGHEIGIESGYGIEFLMSAVMGINEPLKLSAISQVIEYREGLHQKFSAYFEAILQMSNAGCSIGGRSKENRIFRRYIRAVNYLRRRTNYDIESLRKVAEEYFNLLGLESFRCKFEPVIGFMKGHDKKLEALIELAQKMQNNLDNGTITLGKAERKVKEFLGRVQGISQHEARSLLRSYYATIADLII